MAEPTCPLKGLYGSNFVVMYISGLVVHIASPLYTLGITKICIVREGYGISNQGWMTPRPLSEVSSDDLVHSVGIRAVLNIL